MRAKGKLMEIADLELGISGSDTLDFLSDSPLFQNRNIQQFSVMVEHELFFEIILNICTIYACPVNKNNTFLWEYGLDKRRDFFDPSEIRFLESIKQYTAGFFQVKEIDSKNLLTTLQDMFTQKIYKIKDRKLSQIAVRHDIFGGLLVPYNDIFIMEGPSPTVFSPDGKQYLRDTVRLLYKMENKRFRKADDKDLSELLNRSPVSIYRVILDHFLSIQEELASPFPKLFTKDGKELIFLNSYYKISNREEVKNKLLKIRGFGIKKEGRENDEIVWVTTRGNLLGNVYIADKELIFLANTRENLQKWKKLIKDMPLEFIKTEEIDKEELLEGLVESVEDDLLEEKPEGISDEEFRKSAINKWNNFYDAWLQQEHPFLNNRSPAEEAKTKEGKQRVLDLIDGFENEILRAKKVQDMDNTENNLKYFNADELRKRLELL